jgi:hypothetical protein
MKFKVGDVVVYDWISNNNSRYIVEEGAGGVYYLNDLYGNGGGYFNKVAVEENYRLDLKGTRNERLKKLLQI